MLAYYNEHDASAAAWLRELIADGQITPGDVDERNIQEVAADDLKGYTQAHFFAGIGGWSYALRLAGWPDDRPVWTGSCPCQPFSSAGKQAGSADPRHLWPYWARLIRECRPTTIFSEQVESAIAHGWLDAVFDDMEREGYACGAACLPAAGVGAPHIRQRLWFVAESGGTERRLGRPERRGADRGGAHAEPAGSSDPCDAADASRERREGQRLRLQSGTARSEGAEARRDGETGEWGHADVGSFWSPCDWLPCRDGKARPVEPGVEPLVTRVPRVLVPSGDPSEPYVNATSEARVMRLRGYGNAIVPTVAAVFIRAHIEGML